MPSGSIKSEAAPTAFLLFSISPHLAAKKLRARGEHFPTTKSLFFFFLIQLPKVLPLTSHPGDYLQPSQRDTPLPQAQNKTTGLRASVHRLPGRVYSLGAPTHRDWQVGQDGLAAPYWLRRRFFLLLLEKPSRFLLRGCEVRITPRATGFSPGAPGSSPRKGLFSTGTGPPTRACFPDSAAGGWPRPIGLGARECDALWVP